ncbi:MAG: LysR family transcriptional regulator [Bacteriovoracaceae bacterium]|nr:LysR family transcriptional regulator [Bacteriovoracaceae bacterium]
MNWLNYHHLYYFLKVAETGSLSKASELLLIGQPSLSAQIKSLETQLGVLFERRSRRLILNERGKVVLKYARDIFSRGDELMRVIERGELAEQKEVILGAQEGVPKAILAATIIRVKKRLNARVRVIEGGASELIEEAVKGHIDILVTDHEFSNTSGMIYLPIGSERLAIWRSSQLPALNGKYPQNIDNQDFVLPTPGHVLRMNIEKFFLENSISPKVAAEIPDTALIKELGINGIGMIALGETTVRSWVRAGRLEMVGRLPFSQNYWLGIPKKALKNPILDGIGSEFKSKSKT